MRNTVISILALGTIGHTGPAMAAEEAWKDGMMFVEDKVADFQGHTAVKIKFGLEPGKCAGEFTAPDEWLTMTSGTIVFSFPGKDDIVRSAGDHWAATAGTKVTLCNKTSERATLEGIQFRSNN
jgi:hypothetical protein